MNDSGMLPLDQLSHAELYMRRMKPGADQARLGPLEHRAFAREFAQESPVRAAVSLPFAIPAYSAAKAAGLLPARTPASWAELLEAYRGMLEGLGMFSPQPRPEVFRGVNPAIVPNEYPDMSPNWRMRHGVRG